MVEVIEHSNLLEVRSGILCHQVNCIGVMGGALALQIRKKWPNVFGKYREHCGQFMAHPEMMLGHVLDVAVGPTLVVANCFGQVFPSRTGRQTDYESWEVILGRLKDLSIQLSLDVHFPYMIGCGLAGGDWGVMSEKIGRHFGDCQTRAFIHRI